MSFVDYLRDTKGELKHVSWPTRKQAVNYTVLVFAISIVTALFLGFFDTLLTYLLETYVI